MRPLLIVLFASWLMYPPPSRAQEDSAPVHIREGLALAAAGDTMGALAELRQAIEAAPKLAEAHYQLGRLLTRHASGDETDLRDKEAERALMKAYDLDPNNPAIFVELGALRLKQQMRDAAERILERAIKMAEKQEPPDHALLADAYCYLGQTVEVIYDRQRDRRMVPLTRGPISTTIPINRRLDRYVYDYLEDAHPIPGFGEGTRQRLLEYYRAALEHDPANLCASRKLLLHLMDRDEMDEYLQVAGRLVEARPDRGEVFLYLGLGLHAAGREDEAGQAFQRALASLPDEDRAAFMDLSQVMRRRPAEAYTTLDDSTRTSFEEVYWRTGDPLYLTEANERYLEHLARVAYADLRYAEPAAGLRGWETERGIIYIRYGPPDIVASFPIWSGTGLRTEATIGSDGRFQTQEGRSTTTGYTNVWVYDGGIVFMFHKEANYYRASFAGDYQWVADEVRHAKPAKYDNIPSIPLLLSVPVQIARFRGPTPDSVAVEIHSEFPFEDLLRDRDMSSSKIETGLFLVDGRGEQILRQVETEVIDYGDEAGVNNLRSWRLLLPATPRLIAAVEARDAVSWRAAAARDTFTAQLFPEDSLAVSDILFAEWMRPLAGTPVRREDFDIIPNPSLEYAIDQPVHIYYELYGLEPDDNGFASYEVQLTVRVKSVTLEGGLASMLGDIADAWGFTIAGDDRVELRYSREVDMADRDRVTEYLSLDLQRAPAGEYEVTVKIWDRRTQKLASRQRSFTVVKDG